MKPGAASTGSRAVVHSLENIMFQLVLVGLTVFVMAVAVFTLLGMVAGLLLNIYHWAADALKEGA